MNPPYKITARNLGCLELEDQCLADFWWLSNMHFHAPFDNFGSAVFGNCQSMQEAMIGYYLEKDGCLPKAFAPFCDIKERVDVNKHWAKYGYMHKSGVWLYGSPDEVMRRKDGTVVIWDHKTAHPHGDSYSDEGGEASKKSKEKKDCFRPMYEVQVTGYGLIGEEGLDLGRVSAGALCYWDMQYQATIANPAKFIKDGLLYTAFRPVISEVEIDYSRIEKLLKEALKIWKSKVPPEGRDRCKDCKKLEALFALASDVENEVSVRDRTALARSGNDPWVFQMIARRLQDRASRRLSALLELRDADDCFHLEEGGMASQWEFVP